LLRLGRGCHCLLDVVCRELVGYELLHVDRTIADHIQRHGEKPRRRRVTPDDRKLVPIHEVRVDGDSLILWTFCKDEYARATRDVIQRVLIDLPVADGDDDVIERWQFIVH